MSSNQNVSHLYEIKIAGEQLRLRSDEPEERVQKLASYVDDQVSKLHKASSNLSLKQSLILVCLDLAGQIHDLKNQSLEYMQDLEKEALELKKEFQSSLNL
jgi:cell division protein ZapA (FtsZ GTPase activity inhibitor)